MNLLAWVGRSHVGTLSFDGANSRFAFTYAPEWLASRAAFPLAPSLPLVPPPTQTTEHHSTVVRQFFQNLLPEGQALDDAARAHRVSKNSVIGLLRVLGRETSGALMFSLPGEDPFPDTPAPRPIGDKELSERIRQRPEMPFSVWDGKVRLSIAGYQDKLAVFSDGKGWSLVEDPRLASTLIIKPEPVARFMAGMTSNEFMCMRLAGAVGINVAEVNLKHVPEPVLVVKRFDRQLIADREGRTTVQRIHCIDGCQALGLPVDFKYERPYGNSRDVKDVRDGASVKLFLERLNDKSFVTVPAAARTQFLRWTIFQVLIGNTDAHAKNMSFFCRPGGLSIAPAYDLVCGLVYAGENVLDQLAMAVGDNFDPTAIGVYDWAQMAHEASLAPRLVSQEIMRLAKSCLTVLPKLVSELEVEGADPAVLRRVRDIVERQAAEALRVAPMIPKVDRTLF